MQKVKKGDAVKVIAGSFKNHTGTITKVYNKKDKNGKKTSTRIAVSGLKKMQKFKKSFSFQGQKYPGQILEIDRKLDISNVMLLTPKGEISRTKIGEDAGKKVRLYVKDGSVVVQTAKEEMSELKLNAKTLEAAKPEEKVEKSPKAKKDK